MANATVQSRGVILQMTVGITLMKMNVVGPALLRKVGVAGRTPSLKIQTGYQELALIKANDLPKTTHLEMNMVSY